MKNTLLKEFATLSKQIEELEALKEVAKASIIAQMQEKSLDRVKSRYGLFSLGYRTTWAYTAKVEAMELKVKQAKETEVANGSATEKSKTAFVRFQA